jgi:hypothetical protein
VETEFQRACAEAGRVLSGAEGYFVERISFGVDGDADHLDIGLRHGPGKPDILVSFTRLYHARVSKPPEASGSFADALEVVYLPRGSGSWPADAERLMQRHAGLPELLRFRLVGPTEVDVIASAVTVYVEHTVND